MKSKEILFFFAEEPYQQAQHSEMVQFFMSDNDYFLQNVQQDL